ncbi:YdbL family protein [Rahnella sp. PD12R]|nr:YdbL family protein [Rahnella sp. PD12R]
MILASGLLFCSQAFALTLNEAKQQGRVGETLSGYLAPVKQDSESVALAAKINDARKQQYQQVAQDNNVSTDDVARLAGQKLVARAASGEYVRGINGKWLQK